MNDELATALILRLVGAIAGTILALALTPPKTLLGFFLRLVSAMVFGPAFAGQVHFRLGFTDDADGMISAACLTSFVSWQLMAVLKKAAAAWQAKERAED